MIQTIGATAHAQVADRSDLETVLQRYHSILLDDSRSSSDEEIETFVKAISADGTWTDVDYADTSSAGWGPEKHLSRLRNIANRYCHPDSKLYQNQLALDAVRQGIDDWNQNRYQSSNWWYNEIGTPRTMRDIVVLLGDAIEGDRKKQAIEVIHQYKLRGGAANLLWSAEIAVHYGCLTDNPELVSEAVGKIWNEIRVRKNAGIQPDWTFFQHGPRLQAFSYGKAFIEIAVKMSWQMRETPWAIPNAKRAILSNYLLKGTQWMVRGIYTAPSTMDRQFSRKERLKWGDMRQLLVYWLAIEEDKHDSIERFLARQNGSGAPLVGHRHFHIADFTTYHRPRGSIFLKTISNRTSPTETSNRENLKGKRFLHSGDHYVVRDGREIEGLQPVLEWDRLPGITIADSSTVQHQRSFVGGISDGMSGLTAMDYARESKSKTEQKGKAEFEVRKSWFFHNDIMICLMGGWKINGNVKPVVTSVEQCHLRGPTDLADVSGNITTLTDGKSREAAWVRHHGIGYLPLGNQILGNQILQVSNRTQDGTWASINSKFRSETNLLTKPVFRVSINHGVDPEPTGYAIILDATREALVNLATKPSWTVLKNEAACQAIEFEDGLTMVSFFESGVLEFQHANEPETLSVDQPCLAIVSADSLHLCDPSHQGVTVRVEWTGTQVEVTLPSDGTTRDVSTLFDK